ARARRACARGGMRPRAALQCAAGSSARARRARGLHELGVAAAPDALARTRRNRLARARGVGRVRACLRCARAAPQAARSRARRMTAAQVAEAVAARERARLVVPADAVAAAFDRMAAEIT